MTAKPSFKQLSTAPQFSLIAGSFLLAMVAGCQTPPPSGSTTVSGVAKSVVDETPSVPIEKVIAPAPVAAPVAPVAPPKPETATRLAVFQPTGFAQIPGWQEERFDEALATFKKGCPVLAKRSVWASACVEAQRIPAGDNTRAKAFFETEFIPYQVRDKAKSDVASISGYFEPIVRGSKERKAPFLTPIYEAPNDMLFLDSREYEASQNFGDRARFLVDGRRVELITTGDGAIPIGPRIYQLSIDNGQAEARDRRVRLRLVGSRLVAYPSRTDIEASARFPAKVLAWVESREMAYVLQAQGGGKIVTPTSTIKIMVSETNGRPASKIDIAQGYVLPNSDTDALSAGVYGTNLAQVKDGAYSFFREVAPTIETPVGTLGVALTTARSLAVDPRIAPLGAPVMIAMKRPITGLKTNATNRLMIAQDSSLHVKPGVHAEFFAGAGRQGLLTANAASGDAQMWLLLPKGIAQPGVTSAGTKSRLPTAQMRCTISDQTLCPE